MFDKSKILAIPYLIIVLIFYSQLFLKVNFFAADHIALVFGLPNDSMGFIWFMIYLSILDLITHIILTNL